MTAIDFFFKFFIVIQLQLYAFSPLTLYGRLFQMAGDLRRWWVHSLIDHLVFSSQARLFIMGNKQGAVRALRFGEH